MNISKRVEEFLDARPQIVTNPENYRRLCNELIACDREEVLTCFERRFQLPDEEERARAVAGVTRLYGREATDTIIRRINDPSIVVRWVVCGCLHDYGDARAEFALLDRMNHDPDCQVRGTATSALGRIGVMEVLPALYHVQQTDHNVDELGHSPSSYALDAMTTILRDWVVRQIQGTPPKQFEEATRSGKLTGQVNAEGIPFDPEGRIQQTERYSHVPLAKLGNGWMSMLDLQTSLNAPFEIEVAYVDPSCRIERILVFQHLEDGGDVNWAGHTILDPSVMKR
ncbi:HEAT repeat domain-containing protein [Blastopirellula marina]|uniref:HEAT repeat domain-containing protein n=1 Tax=Blastopirellula marina TaxID=124 RepID=UPI001304A089|nr:HEAT repeat domain-containing protein [Blastopirellula marina]